MESRFLDNWTTQLRKGILELCVLNAMKGIRLYGYDIVKRLSGIEGLVIAEGTIYPILSRFKRQGLVDTSQILPVDRARRAVFGRHEPLLGKY